jgi:hypothetical protein
LTVNISLDTVKIMDIRLKLKGPHLWTRARAKEIRADVNEKLGSLSIGGTLVIDLGEVKVFDYSFANELFGKTMLSLAGEYPGRFVIVESLNEYTRENLSKALEGLGLAMIERQKGKLHLIGKVHPADQETFDAIASADSPISAGTLSKELGLNLTAMNERLTKLTELGLVRRDKVSSAAGRQQYEYRVLA